MRRRWYSWLAWLAAAADADAEDDADETYADGMGGGTGSGFLLRPGDGARDGTTGGMCVGEGIGGMTGGSPENVGSSEGYVRLRPGVRVCVEGDRFGVLDDLDGARDNVPDELSSGITGIELGGDCDDVATRGYVWLLVTGLGLDFEGTGVPATISGLRRPAGSSVKPLRKTLEDAEVGGVSRLMDDIVLVIDGMDESRLVG